MRRIFALVVVSFVALFAGTSHAYAADISGGDGNDVLIGTPKSDTFHFSNGNDIIFGNKGSDSITETIGFNFLLGGPGSDGIGGQGELIDDDGTPDDTLLGTAAIANAVISFDGAVDTVNCGAHVDSVAIADTADHVTCAHPIYNSGIHTIEGTEYNVHLGTDTTDVMTGPDPTRADLFAGGPGNDLISSDEPAAIFGGPGKDTMTGGAGAQNIVDDDGKDGDKISAGAGRDVIYAADGGEDKIDCGSGFDTAYVNKGDRVKNCETVIRVTVLDD